MTRKQMDEAADRHVPYRNQLGWQNQLARSVWGVIWAVFCRPSPRVLHGWRRLWLRVFGAALGRGAVIYPTTRVWAPWNLRMGDRACLAAHVDCYNVAQIEIGAGATVSQYAHLCAATHDFRDSEFKLVASPIRIGPGAWVAAGAFIGPGVTVHDRAVVGARACVVKDVAAGVIVAGNPARVVGRRDAEGAGTSLPATSLRNTVAVSVNDRTS